MAEARLDHKTKARWCEHAERYEDMVTEMVELVKGATSALDEEERNLLSVAYKNVVGSRRSSWRAINARFAKDQENPKYLELCKGMKERVEGELNSSCNQVLALLDEHLIPKPENVQAEIFYLKMKGDYYRYMVEVIDESNKAKRAELAEKAESAYANARDIAAEKLDATSPIRLGLALNFSVFYYEIKDDPKAACELAQKAFDDGIAGLEGVAEDVYKDSTLIMQLLRDNLTLWKSETEEDD